LIRYLTNARVSRVLCCAFVVTAVLGLSLLMSAGPVRAAVLTVTSNADSGPGTLRDALAAASTGDEVTFSGGMTIAPLSPMTLAADSVNVNTGGFTVVLDCSSMPAAGATECLLVLSNGNTIDGLRIVGMPTTGDTARGVGVRLRNCSGNTVTNCYLGTRDGTTAEGNDTGVALDNCTYPWTNVGVYGGGNVISGNRTCGLRITGGSQATVQDNFIGTDATGGAALSNGTYGIDLESATNVSVFRNTISASRFSIAKLGTGGESVVSGNHIGTNSSGSAVLSNPATDIGVLVGGTSYGTIGGNNAASRNIIAGVEFGVYIDQNAWATSVTGNYIGTNEDGSAALGIGRAGIVVLNQGSGIGDVFSADGNVIAACAEAGIEVLSPATECRVQSNIIGLDASGTRQLGSTPTGILCTGDHNFIGWPYGLAAPAPSRKLGAGAGYGVGGNIVGGMTTGIDISGGASGNAIESNTLGTDISASTAIPNGTDLRVQGSNNTVGGTREGEGNLISGAVGAGLHIVSGSGNTVYQNTVGTDPTGSVALPNGTGIQVDAGGNLNTIGGEAAGQQNRIARNRGAGIRVINGADHATVAANWIYGNGGLGIDLDPAGPNVPQSNFPYPTAGKPNNNMHFPVIAFASSDGGALTVTGSAEPSSTVRVFFADGDNRHYGQGKMYIGKATASAAGSFTFNAGVSTLATRFVTVTATDGQGNTSEFSLNAPITTPDHLSTVYYLAEGYTANNTCYEGEYFDTFILLQNPSSTKADITATFMRNAGMPNVVKKYAVGPHSRFTINVREVPGLEASDVSSKIECTNGVGIAVERSMYFRYYGKDGGSSSVAVTAPSKTWYFAEGHTANGFDTWLLLQNPGAKEAACTVTFMDQNGNVSRPTYRVAPHSRYTVQVSKVQGFGSNQVSMSVSADQPVVAERSMYFEYCGMADGGHNSVGTPEPATTWYLPEGYTVQDPCRFDTWVLLENPNNASCQVEATYMTNFNAVVTRSYTVRPHSRYTVKVNEIPGLGSTDVSTRVVSTNGVPFVAERSSYFNYHGMTDGSNSMGSPAVHSSWYVPEGLQSDTFSTYILVENPNDTQALIDCTFMTEDGRVINEPLKVAPASRLTIPLDLPQLRNVGVATQVTTSSSTPVIVEKATYYKYSGNGIDGGASSMGIGID
jgi:hypothetical protein